ncbi:hypothetical protein SETIT_3G096600v2, partial [Setaria italica]
ILVRRPRPRLRHLPPPPPLLLGFFGVPSGFMPAEAPHPDAPAAAFFRMHEELRVVRTGNKDAFGSSHCPTPPNQTRPRSISPAAGGSPAMGQVLPVPGAREPPAPALPNHLIEEVLVRIATPRDLVRASAACASFRRTVADASFLRRYRTLHRPLLLGILSPWGLLPAEAPHPNAHVADALSRDTYFSPDHLPPRGRPGWLRSDSRDGRVLRMFYEPKDGTVLPELLVADPLTRGYTLLPPIPESLVASLLGPVCPKLVGDFDAFFVPSGDYEEEHFRVIGWTRDEAMAVAFVYSSLSGTWTAGTRAFWGELGLNVCPEEGMLLLADRWPSYAYGCFYWKVFESNKFLKLDVNRMEFLAVRLSPNHEKQQVIVAEAGEGRIGIVSLTFGREITQSLRYSIRQNEGEIANKHPVETTIPLPSDYDEYWVVAAAEGYIFLLGARYISQGGTSTHCVGSSEFLTLEIKTLKIERVCSARGGVCGHIIPYFGFPPFMSLRRI